MKSTISIGKEMARTLASIIADDIKQYVIDHPAEYAEFVAVEQKKDKTTEQPRQRQSKIFRSQIGA